MPGRGRWLSLGLAAALAAWPLAGGERTPPPEELTNFRLGPDLATWLVGPLSRLASADERAAYLRLADDAAAERFIAEFWERRGGIRPFPPTPGYLFQERVARADVLYREGHHAGHRTDRGTIYALHGAPAAIEFEASPSPGGEPIEIWLYPKDAPPGLDGDSPKRVYSFRRSADGVTRFYSAPIRRRLIDAADPPDGV